MVPEIFCKNVPENLCFFSVFALAMTISTHIYIKKGPLSKFQSGAPYNLDLPLSQESVIKFRVTFYPSFPDSHTILGIPE